MGGELRARNISESFDSGEKIREDFYSLLTLLAPPVVFASGILVLDHGVTDHQLYIRGNGDQFESQRAAVEQQRMVLLSHARNKLVHDADPRTDEFVLGLLAKLRQVAKRNFVFTQTEQSDGSGDLERCRGAESRSDGHLTVNQEIRAIETAARLLQR